MLPPLLHFLVEEVENLTRACLCPSILLVHGHTGEPCTLKERKWESGLTCLKGGIWRLPRLGLRFQGAQLGEGGSEMHYSCLLSFHYRVDIG